MRALSPVSCFRDPVELADIDQIAKDGAQFRPGAFAWGGAGVFPFDEGMQLGRNASEGASRDLP